jgi:hypothetical protein
MGEESVLALAARIEELRPIGPPPGVGVARSG